MHVRKFEYNGCQRTVSTNHQVAVAINGEIRSIPDGQTILRLLESLDLDPARVAVELDRRIVKPRDWDRTPIADGARLEIVQFVGGG
jgi:thiamine biosynthesis protein ThiS